MCEDCRIKNQERKIAQFEEPRESHRGTRKRSEKTKGRKTRLDELNQSEKDFWQAFEWLEEAKAREAHCQYAPAHQGHGWRCGHRLVDLAWLQSRRERYDALYQSFLKDFGKPF